MTVDFSDPVTSITILKSLEPAFPNVHSWEKYHSLRAEFTVEIYRNDEEVSRTQYLWMYDGEGNKWIPRDNYGGTVSVSQISEDDVIKIVFKGDLFCSVFFGSDNTHPSLGIYQHNLDHINKEYVAE